MAIFKVDSEYLRFPFKLMVDYFILYSILVYSFVIFLIFFCYEQRRCTFEAERSFIRMFISSSVNRNERRLINMWSAGRLIYISVSIKGTFWYLSVFFLEWSTFNFCYSSRFVSLGFTIRTVRTQKNLLRFLFFLPLSSFCNPIC